MGCDTRLHVSSKWRLDEIVEVIENHVSLEERQISKKVFNPATRRNRTKKVMVKTRVEHCEAVPGMFNIFFKVNLSEFEEGRMMFVHHNTNTPLGPCTLLSLGMNDEAISIMKAIAVVLGGYLEENDCECKGEMIQGSADNRSDGLVYFVSSGIREGKFGNTEQSLDDLKTYIDEWHVKVGH